MKAPTDKQIAYVEYICNALHLDFPTSSKEFNRKCFSDFISAHIKDLASTYDDVDFVYEYCAPENDVWCEHY